MGIKSTKEYVLHSGGARGADSEFEIIGREFGLIHFNHYWYGKRNPFSKIDDKISEEDYEEGVEMVYKANKILKRQNLDKYMNLLARNWSQVKYSDAIYAISTLKNNKEVNGGTSWACVFGILTDKPVYVFDQEKEQWFFWNDNKFEVCVCPKLTLNFAGIGTREINQSGINAIRNLYTKTLK
jgi:hypothetical protein